MSPYRIIRTHHGDYEAHDLGGHVAQIWFDPHSEAWCIAVNVVRFPKTADLPAIFDGMQAHLIPRFGDVFRFFGLPLPGAAEIARAVEMIGEAA